MKLFALRRFFPFLCLAVGLVVFGLAYTLPVSGQSCSEVRIYSECSSAGDVIKYKCGIPLPPNWSVRRCCDEGCYSNSDADFYGCGGWSCVQWNHCSNCLEYDIFECGSCGC